MSSNQIKQNLLAAAIGLAGLCVGQSALATNGSNSLFKVSPTPIYHTADHTPLKDALAKISTRAGITFKVNPDISQDKLSKSVSANNWKEAISKLLEDYNFAAIEKRGVIKVVIVANRRTSTTSKPSDLETNNMLTIAPTAEPLPDKYKAYPLGSVTAIQLPLNKIMATQGKSNVVVDLPMGQFNVTHDRTVNELDGSSTWVGYLKDEGEGYHIFLSQGDAGVMGHITTPDGAYNIEGDQNGSYLIDTSKLTSVGFQNDTQATTINNNATPANQSIGNTAFAPQPEVTNQVDLMVVYSTSGQTAAYVKQRLSYLVTVSNQAYIDSKMNMSLRLVHTEPTTYTDQSSNSLALSDLANAQGAFTGIKAKRNQYGADLVFLFRPLYVGVAGSCGTTYVGFSGGIPGDPAYGYGTISDGIAKDNSAFLCGINAFTHEIGHSLGLVHDIEYSNAPGAFADSYAFGIDTKFATIMSYKSPLVMLFSTPDLPTQCAGTPCGFAGHSNQNKTVNYTAPIVSQYLPITTAVPVLN